MATIGNWGDFTFYVSRSSIKTFDDLKWESSVKYATHERHLKEPLLEFTGQGVESMTFTMFFSAFLGVNPSYLIQLLMEAGVKRVEVRSPAFTTVADNAVAQIGETSIVNGGAESE